jgi:beta-glucanase (GH16 family)
VLKGRELTFSDEFEGNKRDSSKWIPNYYWGEKLLNDRYSVESDLQTYTEQENFEIRNSVLKITTRQQKTNGKAWTTDKGFILKEFGYTSGIICSGASFRQKHGIFQAKIKLGNANAKSAFWMLADRITPHIDVCKTSKGKVWFDFFPLNGDVAKTSLRSKYADDFYIFTLEWTADKLIWKINNIEVLTQESNIPQDPMYILLSGGLDKPISGTTSMEIDWIRVYRFV